MGGDATFSISAPPIHDVTEFMNISSELVFLLIKDNYVAFKNTCTKSSKEHKNKFWYLFLSSGL